MRTTLDLPEPLLREAKLRAVQQGVTLKDLLAQYIEAGINDPASALPPTPPQHIPLPYFRSADGPLVPARSNAQLYAILEEEDIANYHQLVTPFEPQS